MIVHILKMCTYYFVHDLQIFFLFLRGVELRHRSIRNVKGVPSLFIFKNLHNDFAHIEDVHLPFFCTFNFFLTCV